MQEKLSILNRPLRVMHIISGDLWAGAESQAFTLLKHLNANTKLHVVVMNDGELLRRLQNLNISVTLLPESTLTSLKILTQLTSLIRNFKPDILHTHRQKENILGNIANVLASLPFKKRTPSVRTAHGAPEFAPKGKQKIQVWIDHWIGKNLQQGVIAVSNDLGDKLKSIFPANKIFVIHNGVDSDTLFAEASYTDFRIKEPNHIHIGIIGRIEQVKRIDIFIEMANLLLKNKQLSAPLKFHVIGDGSLRSAMEKKVSDLSLYEKVIFHGHRSDIGSCIKSLDAIVMCSDHEGTPMIALETLALGKPLVAHNVGGLKEILQNLEVLLVSPNVPIEYANKLSQLLSNDSVKVHLDKKYNA
ncbi:MAG: glycosyltransferase, partial [Cellvibrio sp.]